MQKVHLLLQGILEVENKEMAGEREMWVIRPALAAIGDCASPICTLANQVLRKTIEKLKVAGDTPAKTPGE